MGTFLIVVFILGSIVYALFVSGILRNKRSQTTQTQTAQNLAPAVTSTPTTTKGWVTGLSIFLGIMGVVLLIWFLSWYFNGITNYHLEKGEVYSIEIPFPKKFSADGHGKKFYASIDGNNWRLVGDGLPRNDWGQKVRVYYFKYYEPETKVTVRVYQR